MVMSHSPGLGEGDSRATPMPIKARGSPSDGESLVPKGERSQREQKRWRHQGWSKEPAPRKVRKENKEGSPRLAMKPPPFLVSYFPTPQL